MTKEADIQGQDPISPVWGYMVLTIFRAGRYGYLPASIVALLGWVLADVPWYIPAIFAFGFVYFEYLRRGFLRKIPFYWPTKEQ